MLFLSKDREDRLKARRMVEQIVKEEGQRVLGWREVPVNSNAIGWLARESEPAIEQVFIGRGESAEDLSIEQWERKLYVIRKRTRLEAVNLQLARYYPATMSARTIVYKGLLIAPQIPHYYPDLHDPDFVSAIALVHQRFSTNTFPTWERAQPFRYLAHNGEINTLRGNVNWMSAREATLHSDLFGDDLDKIKPIIDIEGSDSTMIDNALEVLIQGGRAPAHSLAMLIPEAWSSHAHMPDAKKAFYEYHATMMEPWDGPASIVFTDGRYVGGNLDRNGLRPSRFWVTHDNLVVMASETGVVSEIEPSQVRVKGRLQPGRMFLVDTEEGRIIADEEIKATLASRKPYREWLDNQLFDLEKLPYPNECPRSGLRRRWSSASACLRLHARGSTRADRPDGREWRRADRLDGRRRPAGLPLGSSAASVQLLQATVRPGHQPGDRPDSRRAGHVDLHLRGSAGQPVRREGRACAPLEGAQSDLDRRERGEAARDRRTGASQRRRTAGALRLPHAEDAVSCGGCEKRVWRRRSTRFAPRPKPPLAPATAR